MGWTYTHKEKGQSIEDFFQQRMPSIEILKCKVVNLREVYMAARFKKSPEQIFALVCLFSFYPRDPDNNFGYKAMEEVMGPYYYNCPEEILKMLTPTDYERANEWRQKCWDNINRQNHLL